MADPTSSHAPLDAHGHADPGDGQQALGPIDVNAWGAGALGVFIGLVIAFCFALASSPAAG
jgi:hypothetical protein